MFELHSVGRKTVTGTPKGKSAPIATDINFFGIQLSEVG
jgi:hypothetical protein